ncbi:hypothetical protein HDU67_008428 [Dinochytrium kinnereticum]|nr:hypothetical protein HDU67_008428 [Dinochytrium kinnereticum]
MAIAVAAAMMGLTLLILSLYAVACCFSSGSSDTAAIATVPPITKGKASSSAHAFRADTLTCFENSLDWTVDSPPNRDEAKRDLARHTVDASTHSCISWPVLCSISEDTGMNTQFDPLGFTDPQLTPCAIEDFTINGTLVMSLGVLDSPLCEDVEKLFAGASCCREDECNKPMERPAEGVKLNQKLFGEEDVKEGFRSCFVSNIMDLSQPPIRMDSSMADIMKYNGCTKYPLVYQESLIAHMHWGANITDCNMHQRFFKEDICCFGDYCNE